MNKLNMVSLKIIRWSGWLLLPLVAGFLFTGYTMTANTALTGCWTKNPR